MATVLRFVDSIQALPTVRLDLSDWVTWGALAETDFGMPAMRRSVTSSMLRDGEYVGASSYGNRELNLVLELLPKSADAAATQLQLLQRELDRPTNLLQYIPGGATLPVFFRTFRSSPDAVRFDPISKRVRVTLLAEPFALGIREDLAAVTVRNDPTLTNGLFADLTGIKGDVETPLFIEYADGAGGLARSGFTVGVRSGSSPYPNRFIQAEGMSMSGPTDTSVVTDATFSGGSKARCTFATVPSNSLRLFSYFPSPTVPAGPENWGVYRVFARVAQTVATDVITVSVFPNQAVTIRSQTQPQMVDLGTVDSTTGLATVGGYAATEYRIGATGDQFRLSFQAARTSGSGFLDIDYLVFVPADECLGSWAAFLDVIATTDLGVIDGLNDSAYVASALSGAMPGRSTTRSAAITGRLPRVMPGNNRLVIVETSKSTFPTANSLTSSITMTIRYWPRYILARPVLT